MKDSMKELEAGFARVESEPDAIVRYNSDIIVLERGGRKRNREAIATETVDDWVDGGSVN